MASDQIDTTVGPHVELTGSLRNTASIHILGHVKGDIVSEAAVLVGENARVEGPIQAKMVDVAGTVIGNITAKELVELKPKSVVKGDVTTGTLSVKPGANLMGKVKVSQGSQNVKEEAEAAE